MYGMLCAMLATGIWLILATYLEVRPRWSSPSCWGAAAASCLAWP